MFFVRNNMYRLYMYVVGSCRNSHFIITLAAEPDARLYHIKWCHCLATWRQSPSFMISRLDEISLIREYIQLWWQYSEKHGTAYHVRLVQWNNHGTVLTLTGRILNLFGINAHAHWALLSSQEILGKSWTVTKEFAFWKITYFRCFPWFSKLTSI